MTWLFEVLGNLLLGAVNAMLGLGCELTANRHDDPHTAERKALTKGLIVACIASILTSLTTMFVATVLDNGSAAGAHQGIVDAVRQGVVILATVFTALSLLAVAYHCYGLYRVERR